MVIAMITLWFWLMKNFLRITKIFFLLLLFQRKAFLNPRALKVYKNITYKQSYKSRQDNKISVTMKLWCLPTDQSPVRKIRLETYRLSKDETRQSPRRFAGNFVSIYHIKNKINVQSLFMVPKRRLLWTHVQASLTLSFWLSDLKTRHR